MCPQGTANTRHVGSAVSAVPAPGARTLVRIDEEMSADLAVLKSAGFTVTEALREGVRVLAEVRRNGWGMGLPEGTPLESVGAQIQRVLDVVPASARCGPRARGGGAHPAAGCHVTRRFMTLQPPRGRDAHTTPSR